MDLESEINDDDDDDNSCPSDLGALFVASKVNTLGLKLKKHYVVTVAELVTSVLATAIYGHFIYNIKPDVNRASLFIYACLWMLTLPNPNPNSVLENWR